MELYTTLEQILLCQNPADKIAAFREFYALYRVNNYTIDAASKIRYFETPSYASFCHIVDPKTVPRRNKLGTADGQILLLHAIAHIEYSAIDLALDAAYRFRDVPETEAFIRDWLRVADDEVRHFLMIEKLLEELGSHYGAVPVHDALFEASQRTVTLLERMAVVPRYLEANGLDATPLILNKLATLKKEAMILKIMDALQIILDEEVEHVRIGDYWFNVACDHAGVEKKVYFEIIETLYPKSFPRKIEVNTQARKEAGFVCAELEKISATKPC